MAAEFTTAVNSLTLEYADIEQFQDHPGLGLRCGCSCPKCGGRVGTRIFQNPESSCFFHEAEEKNVTCNGGGPETYLHRLAKRVLEESREICLPGSRGKPVRFTYTKVLLEKKLGYLRPDLILTTAEGNQLIVEITVTHPTFSNPEKMSLLRALNIPAIEITLDNNLFLRLLMTNPDVIPFALFSKTFGKSIIESISNKRWLVNGDDLGLAIEEQNSETTLTPSDNERQGGGWFFALLLLFFFLVVTRMLRKSKRRRRGR